MLTGRLILTGGAGTLGEAIIRRATEEKWDCQITVFSTDAMKHLKLKAKYPKVQYVVGDIRDANALLNVMTGKDYCLHLAAVKHIDVSEYSSIDTYEINVGGSLNVCAVAMQLGVPHVLGISTDKAVHPANCYGATKMLMERVFQEYARLDIPTQYHLVRYGNVIESSGSVVQAWKKSIARGENIKITDPQMSRFWLNPSRAVDCVLKALECPSGCVYIPRMPSLSIGKLMQYTVGDVLFERVPIRPGEKMNESLLSEEEGWYALQSPEAFLLAPNTAGRFTTAVPPYSSDMAPELTREELEKLLEEG